MATKSTLRLVIEAGDIQFANVVEATETFERRQPITFEEWSKQTGRKLAAKGFAKVSTNDPLATERSKNCKRVTDHERAKN